MFSLPIINNILPEIEVFSVTEFNLSLFTSIHNNKSHEWSRIFNWIIFQSQFSTFNRLDSFFLFFPISLAQFSHNYFPFLSLLFFIKNHLEVCFCCYCCCCCMAFWFMDTFSFYCYYLASFYFKKKKTLNARKKHTQENCFSFILFLFV